MAEKTISGIGGFTLLCDSNEIEFLTQEGLLLKSKINEHGDRLITRMFRWKEININREMGNSYLLQFRVNGKCRDENHLTFWGLVDRLKRYCCIDPITNHVKYLELALKEYLRLKYLPKKPVPVFDEYEERIFEMVDHSLNHWFLEDTTQMAVYSINRSELIQILISGQCPLNNKYMRCRESISDEMYPIPGCLDCKYYIIVDCEIEDQMTNHCKKNAGIYDSWYFMQCIIRTCFRISKINHSTIFAEKFIEWKMSKK